MTRQNTQSFCHSILLDDAITMDSKVIIWNTHIHRCTLIGTCHLQAHFLKFQSHFCFLFLTSIVHGGHSLISSAKLCCSDTILAINMVDITLRLIWIILFIWAILVFWGSEIWDCHILLANDGNVSLGTEETNCFYFYSTQFKEFLLPFCSVATFKEFISTFYVWSCR